MMLHQCQGYMDDGKDDIIKQRQLVSRNSAEGFNAE